MRYVFRSQSIVHEAPKNSDALPNVVGNNSRISKAMPTSILNVHYTRVSKSACKSVIATKSLLGVRHEVNYDQNMETVARHW